MKPENTEDDLIVAIDAELSRALDSENSELSRQRAKAMEFYLGRPYGNELPDRSHVVTREVMDTVEWIMPQLIKIFASGGDTVRFEPNKPSAVEEAAQKTDYANYILNRKNPGFLILYQWLKDGLLAKNGYVKATWQEDACKRREEYKGLSQGELLMLASDPDVEVIQSNSYDSPLATTQREQLLAQANEMMAQAPPEQAQMMQQQLQSQLDQPLPQVYDVVIHRSQPEGGIVIENIPPEEFVISDDAKSIEDSVFCAHVRDVTVSELRRMGYEFDEDALPSTTTHLDNNEEKLARYSNERRQPDKMRVHTDPAMREVTVSESYLNFDFDNDGIAELRKVVKVGDVIFENQEVDCKPFASWTPIILAHKHVGLSLADLTMDLQKIQSQLFRNLLDNQYLTNNGRYFAVDGQVEMDDLLVSRPHGVVRVRAPGAVGRIDTPQLGQTAFDMLSYVDMLREKRTGVSERTQGLGDKALQPNTAATAVSQVMTAAQQRIELIARVFGETGLTSLFKLIHKIAYQNQREPAMFKLRDKYVTIDPSSWTDGADTTVVVGLGNGSREQEMLQLNMIFQNQMALSQNPKFQALVSPVNVYATLEDQVRVFNKAAAGRHFTDPSSPEAQQAAQQAAQQQQMMMAMQQRQAEMQAQLQQMAIEIEKFRAEEKAKHDAGKLLIDKQRLDQDASEYAQDHDLAEREHEAEVRIEMEQKREAHIG